MTPVEITSNENHGTCPCCGAPLVLHGVQKYRPFLDRDDVKIVHCLQDGCAMKLATTTNIMEAWEMRGKPVQGGK